jgi:hypothetical protein
MFEGGEQLECALSDVSDRGACITVHDSDAIPEKFLLLLAQNGAARRRCRVIWRKPRQVGVKFETWLDNRIRTPNTAKPAPDTGAKKQVEPAESGT